MRIEEVDYLIIGAGMAGTVLHRFLNSASVVLLDPKPGRYKIGESIVPEHFHHPILRALLPKVRALPSYAPKWGSTFVSDHSVASFPLPPHGAEAAMHIDRSELERLMHQEWQTPIVHEAARDIDMAHNVVRTSTTEYRVAKQILDCSGPSMVVARSLGIIQELWPVQARWAYFDVANVHEERWWQHIEDRGLSYRRFDIPKGVLLDGTEIDGWRPSHNTTLTRVDADRWLWQIPLFGCKRMSVGLVSRSRKPITDRELFDIAYTHVAPQYTLQPRPLDHSSSYNRVHARSGFARTATEIATADYVLLADACCFADPIYSVGTGLAVNKAIELAAILNGPGWNPQTLATWKADYHALITRAVAAFETWYDGSLLTEDGRAAEVQHQFLEGSAFQVAVAHRYSQQIVDAGAPADQPGPDGRGRHIVDADAKALTHPVSKLLGVKPGEKLAGWVFDGAFAASAQTQIRWSRQGRPQLIVNASCDPGETKYFRRVGDVSLSFMNLFEQSYPLGDDGVALFDAIEAAVGRDETGWRALRPE